VDEVAEALGLLRQQEVFAGAAGEVVGGCSTDEGIVARAAEQGGGEIRDFQVVISVAPADLNPSDLREARKLGEAAFELERTVVVINKEVAIGGAADLNDVVAGGAVDRENTVVEGDGHQAARLEFFEVPPLGGLKS
jgi:hypothetical protein